MTLLFDTYKPFGEQFVTDNDTQACLLLLSVDIAQSNPTEAKWNFWNLFQRLCHQCSAFILTLYKLTIFQKIKSVSSPLLNWNAFISKSEVLLGKRSTYTISVNKLFAEERQNALCILDYIITVSQISSQLWHYPFKILSAIKHYTKSLKILLVLHSDQNVKLFRHIMWGQAMDLFRNYIEGMTLPGKAHGKQCIKNSIRTSEWKQGGKNFVHFISLILRPATKLRKTQWFILQWMARKFTEKQMGIESWFVQEGCFARCQARQQVGSSGNILNNF